MTHYLFTYHFDTISKNLSLKNPRSNFSQKTDLRLLSPLQSKPSLYNVNAHGGGAKRCSPHQRLLRSSAVGLWWFSRWFCVSGEIIGGFRPVSLCFS
jgi:hypothetical protein